MDIKCFVVGSGINADGTFYSRLAKLVSIPAKNLEFLDSKSPIFIEEKKPVGTMVVLQQSVK